MNKFDYIKNIKILVLAIVFASGFSLVYSWVGPTSSAPYENIGAPINSGGVTQYRVGNLVLKDDPDLDDGSLEGSLSADKVTVAGSSFGPSYFFSQFNVGSPVLDGGAGTDPKLVSEVNSNITFASLSSLNNPGVSYPARVCVSDDGFVSLCENVPTAPEEEYTASGMITIVSQTFNNVDATQSLSCPADYPIEINSGVVCLTGSNKIAKDIVNQNDFVDEGNGILMEGDSSAQGECTGNNFNIKVWAICAK